MGIGGEAGSEGSGSAPLYTLFRTPMKGINGCLFPGDEIE